MDAEEALEAPATLSRVDQRECGVPQDPTPARCWITACGEQGIEGAPDPEGKYKMYVQYTRPASKILPSHASRYAAAPRKAFCASRIELARSSRSRYLKNKVIREHGIGPAARTAPWKTR